MSVSPVRVRVRYPEVDRMNVVHHSHYFVWFEIGRTEVMRALGLTYASLEDEQGLLFPLVEASARYRAPARYDEEVEIHTAVAHADRLRVRFAYEVRRVGSGELLAEGQTEHVAVTRSGRPCRMPSAFAERLRTWNDRLTVPEKSA